MKLGRLGALLVTLAMSPLAFSGTDKEVRFFFSQTRGGICYEAKAAYESLQDIYIQDVEYSSFDISGSLPGFKRVILKLRHTSVLGTGGFGPSGWIDSYTCSIEKN